jgi:ankyrin repeat protein
MLTMNKSKGRSMTKQNEKTKAKGAAKAAKPSEKAVTKAGLKAFAKAAAAGDVPAVRRLTARHPALAHGWQPITDAAFNGHADVVKFLLDHGADANILSATNHRHRPLHRVVEHKKSIAKTAQHLDVVKILLENGGDVNARGTWCNVTPIALAAMGPEAQFLPLLLPYLDQYDLYTAAILGQTRQVATILKRDPARAKIPDINGLTALHYVAASRLGNDDAAMSEKLKRIAEMLIDAGADLHAPARLGHYAAMPPIHFASGNKSVLQLLVLKGADAAAALLPALWAGDYEIAEMLFRAGANLKSKQAGAWMSDFVHWGHYPHAEWLIERGTDVNGRTKDGRTALHWAVQRGASAEFVRFLFDHGADASLHDAEGATALSLAKSKNRSRLSALLQKHGAKE